jgi:hypothetical protein
MLNRFKDLGVFASFFVTGVLYFHPMLSAKVIFCERDLAPFFIPPRILWVSLLKNLEFPFWNPYNYCGIPLLATLQPGVFYPPHIFYLFLPFNIVWNWMIILHFAFAGMTTYAFLRYIKVSVLSSVTGGLVFMLSGYLLSVHNLLPHLFGVSWFPLVLLYFIKYFETERVRHIILSSVFLTIQFFAGAPEIVILTVIVLFITVFFLGSFADKRIGIVKRCFTLCLLGLVVFLLSAVQWTTFYELHRLSIRATGLNYISATTWSFAWKDFIQFFLPDVFGYRQTPLKYWLNQSWLKTVYLGMGPLLFSAVFFLKSDKRRLFFLGLIVFSLILGLGGNTPLYKLLHKIPPFSSMRYPVKFLFLLFFSISVTTAIGLDAFRESIKDRAVNRLILASFYLGFVFALAWGFLHFWDQEIISFLDQKGIKPPLYNEIWFNIHNTKRFLLFSFLLCTGLLLYARLRLKKILLSFLVLLLIADLFLANYGYYGSASWEWFKGSDGFAKMMERNEETERFYLTVKTDDEFSSILAGKNLMVSPYAAMYGLYSAGGAEVMRIAHQDRFLGLFRCVGNISEARELLNIGGIKHIILSYPVDYPEFRLVKQERLGDKDIYLYLYRGYPGRFLLFNTIHYIDDDNKVMLKMIDRKTDFKKELILSAPAEEAWMDRQQAGPIKGTVDLVSYRANEVVLAYKADRDGFLYASDTYYPGWRAYVDGRETKIYRANLAFRAIEVPKGRHTVVFRYVPVSFYVGLSLTLLGIALCIWLWRRDGRKAVALGSGQGNETPGDAVSGT